jgi:uncharacterized protein YdgA (DUF945 family)
MKKLAILVLILVVALFVTPGLIGFKVQSGHQQIIAGMQQNGFTVVSDNYRRGWFGAQSKTEFELAMPSGVKGKSFAFTMIGDIVHGPLSPDGGLVLASIETSFQVDGKALFPEDENAVLISNIGLNGEGKTVISIPALKFAGKPGRPEIQFSGVDGVVLFDVGLTHATADIKMPGLWVGGEKGESLQFTDVTLNSDSKAGLLGMFLGSGRFNIKQIDFKNPENNVAINIDAISVSGDSSEEGGNLIFDANYAVNAVTVNGTVYGPAQLELGIENIPAEVAAKLQKELQRVRSLKLTQEQEGMAVMSMMVGAAPDLLKANPKMTINRLFVKTPDGDIDGKFSIASNGLQWNEITNIQTVLQKLEADAAISLPEKLLKAVMGMQAKVALMRQIEQRKKMGHEITVPSKEELDKLSEEMVEKQLTFLLQQEMAKRDGTVISSNAMLSGGLLSVNGKTIPLQ